jgi:uncharacterized membrane protein YqjE
MPDSRQRNGLFTSLSRFLDTAIEMSQVRLDLLGTEVEFEKRRVFDGLLWGAFAMLALDVGLVLLCGFITLMFWEGYRLAAVGVMAALFVAMGLLLMREARQRIRSPAGMFKVSVAELERDRGGLQAPGRHGQ